jgi:hypothetical protein
MDLKCPLDKSHAYRDIFRILEFIFPDDDINLYS